MLSKKYYKAIAELFNSRKVVLWDKESIDTFHARELQWASFAIALADLFADDNPNFDRIRFLKACGIEQ